MDVRRAVVMLNGRSTISSRRTATRTVALPESESREPKLPDRR